MDSKAWVTLELTNPLDEEITVFDVTTSCGCVATYFQPASLMPGKTMEIEITFSSKNRSGSISERAKVFSTSGLLNNIDLVIHGDVVQGPLFEDDFRFGTFRPEMGAETTVQVIYASVEWCPDVDSVIAICDNPFLPLDFSVKRLDQDTLEVSCIISPSSIRGFFEADVRFYLNPALIGESGVFLETKVTGAGIPVIWAEPMELLGSQKLDNASIYLNWLEDVDVHFPEKSKSWAGGSWSIRQVESKGHRAVLKLKLDKVDSILDRGGLLVPFEIDGQDFNLTIPFFPEQ